jgi:hypothetical protein
MLNYKVAGICDQREQHLNNLIIILMKRYSFLIFCIIEQQQDSPRLKQ